MHSYLLTIAYHGGDFAGWQRQAGFDSVQGALEDAIETIVGEPVVEIVEDVAFHHPAGAAAERRLQARKRVAFVLGEAIEEVLLADYQLTRGQIDGLWAYVGNKGEKKLSRD